MSRFCVRLRGNAAEIAPLFPGFHTTEDGGIVSVCGDFDEAGLHGALQRVRVFGYELIDVHRRSSTSHPWSES